jgi:hypothetical protein
MHLACAAYCSDIVFLLLTYSTVQLLSAPVAFGSTAKLPNHRTKILTFNPLLVY